MSPAVLTAPARGTAKTEQWQARKPTPDPGQIRRAKRPERAGQGREGREWRKAARGHARGPARGGVGLTLNSAQTNFGKNIYVGFL